MESLIVVRFVVFSWEICSFIVGRFVVLLLYLFGTVLLLVGLDFFLYITLGQFYCWKICSFLLVPFIVVRFVVICWEI